MFVLSRSTKTCKQHFGKTKQIKNSLFLYSILLDIPKDLSSEPTLNIERSERVKHRMKLPLSSIVQYLYSSKKVQTEFLMEELEKSGNERIRENTLKF